MQITPFVALLEVLQMNSRRLQTYIACLQRLDNGMMEAIGRCCQACCVFSTLVAQIIEGVGCHRFEVVGEHRVEGVDFGSPNCPESIFTPGQFFGSFDALGS